MGFVLTIGVVVFLVVVLVGAVGVLIDRTTE
jgi:hypothetical protein